MSPDNETVVRRFFEEFCNGRAGEIAEELMTEDFISHGPQAPTAEGHDGVRGRVAVYQEALDGHWNVEQIIGAGDHVFARRTGTGTQRRELMGLQPTGSHISVDAISVFRMADGRI